MAPWLSDYAVRARSYRLSITGLTHQRASYLLSVDEYGFVPRGTFTDIHITRSTETGFALLGPDGFTRRRVTPRVVSRATVPSQRVQQGPDGWVDMATGTWTNIAPGTPLVGNFAFGRTKAATTATVNGQNVYAYYDHTPGAAPVYGPAFGGGSCTSPTSTRGSTGTGRPGRRRGGCRPTTDRPRRW